jgi:ankyrin repeat protein
MKSLRMFLFFITTTTFSYAAQVNDLQNEVATQNVNAASEALVVAAVYGGVKEIKQALLDGAEINFKNNEGQTALYLVSKLSRYDLVELLLAHGADVNLVGDDKISPLHWAVEYNNTHIVELLLKNGASVTAKDGLGEIPLHWAAWTGRVESARLLLEYGSDPRAENNDGVTPIKLAVRQEHQELTQLFKAY